MLPLAHQLLRFLGVVPEVRIFGAGVQPFEVVFEQVPSQRCLLSRLMACLISSTTTWVSARIVLLFHAGVWKAFLPKRADHKVRSARCKGIKGDDCRERQ
jgi:hypothetical protein